MTGRDGAIIDKLGIRCTSLSESGTLGTVVTKGGEAGGEGGLPFAKDCPSGNVVYTIEGNRADFNDVERTGELRFNCKNNSSGDISSWYPGSSSYWGTSSGKGAYNFRCGSSVNPNGTHLTGIIIDNSGGNEYVGPILGVTCR